MPYGTFQNLNTWFFWYLSQSVAEVPSVVGTGVVLKAFTCASLPAQNAIALEFISALPLGYWVF
jgi:uncharacterized membrane protein